MQRYAIRRWCTPKPCHGDVLLKLLCGGGIGRRLAGRWASGCTREELPGTVQRPTCGVQIPAHTMIIRSGNLLFEVIYPNY